MAKMRERCLKGMGICLRPVAFPVVASHEQPPEYSYPGKLSPGYAHSGPAHRKESPTPAIHGAPEKANRSSHGGLVRRNDHAVEFFEHFLSEPVHDFKEALDSKLMHRFCLEHHDVGPQILGNRHGD